MSKNCVKTSKVHTYALNDNFELVLPSGIICLYGIEKQKLELQTVGKALKRNVLERPNTKI